MKFYLGVTDIGWYSYLSKINPEDINFWQPGGKSSFKVLKEGEPFLFKLKSPINAIGGVGFFSSHSILPLNMAWEIFGDRNGTSSYTVFKQKILDYRSKKNSFYDNPNIGCIVLTNPIFFDKKDWIKVPSNWKRSIVQGKSYNTKETIGAELWNKVKLTLLKYQYQNTDILKTNRLASVEENTPSYTTKLTKVRIGQGAFRVKVIDAYNRKCSISGEKTLPVLEAAHIKSYSVSGANHVSNGLLMRADLHKLFDSGYLTVTKDYKIEVSSRIKLEFNNGKDYYKYHGKDLFILPKKLEEKPNINFIEWHNSNIFKD